VFYKIYKSIILITLCALFAGCKSQSDRIYDICKDMESAAEEGSDCQLMGKKLSRAATKLNFELKKLRALENPSQEQKTALIQAISPCTAALLKTSMSSCKDDADVQKALNSVDGAWE